jgi:hypothetical protein
LWSQAGQPVLGIGGIGQGVGQRAGNGNHDLSTLSGTAY